MPGVDFRAVRAQVGMRAVLALLGWRPRSRRGEQWRGPCPLHGSRSPTSRCFAVHVGKNVYHCFGCGAAGNALELYAAVTRQDLDCLSSASRELSRSFKRAKRISRLAS